MNTGMSLLIFTIVVNQQTSRRLWLQKALNLVRFKPAGAELFA
jgi:hypothetical protein